jgi:hypothetical protein
MAVYNHRAGPSAGPGVDHLGQTSAIPYQVESYAGLPG